MLHNARYIPMKYDPIDIPLYHLGTAARWVGVPATTLRHWMYGREYVAWGHRKSSPRVIEPADAQRGLLSFANITEAHLVQATRSYGISLLDIRTAIDRIRQEHPSDSHPLLSGSLRHRGKSLYAETVSGLISTSSPTVGQTFLHGFTADLERIEIKRDGHIRLFPIRRNDSKTVVLNSDVAGGQPIITNTGILVEDIQDLRKAGMSTKKIAKQYALDEATIVQAINYIKRSAA